MEPPLPLIVRTPIDVAGLKEADRLARYAYAPILRLVYEKEAWLGVISGTILAVANLLGKKHEPWRAVFLLYAVAAGFFLLTHLAWELRFRLRVKKFNRTPVGIEFTHSGVRFHGPGTMVRSSLWSSYLEAKAGKHVVTVFYRSKKGLKRRKFFLVPLRDLSSAERIDLLLQIPERLRGKGIQDSLAAWKLS